ncbi:hypothetical protein LY90DRAFT_457116, partial [Neocallimastix californiae]
MKNENLNLINECKNGNIKEIRQLLKNNIDVNIKNEYGDSPLTIACEKRNFEIIKYLIKKGAKINVTNSTGSSPLNILCKEKSKDILEITLEIIDYLLKKGAEINYKDENGLTPLLIACYFNNKKVLKMLLSFNEADINIKNNYGDSPFMVSDYFCDKKIIKYLEEYKAKMDQNQKCTNEDSLKIISKKNQNKNFNEELKADKMIKTIFLNRNESNFESQSSHDFNDENDVESQTNSDNYSNKTDLKSQPSDNSNNESDLESMISSENDSNNDNIISQIYKLKYIDQHIIDSEKIISLKLHNLNLISQSYISIKIHEILLNISKKSICCINLGPKSGGTGFFIKLSIPSEQKPLYGLITNNHVLNSDYFKNNDVVKISSNEKEDSFIIKLNNTFIFTSEFIDITFIQLSDDIYSKNPEIFLDPCDDDDYCDDDRFTYIFQYPKKKLSFATGYIKSSSGFSYFHTASTDGGSSGSPLLNRDMKIIGVHKAGSESDNINIATKMSIVKYSITTLYYKGYSNEIRKAREPVRELSKDEIKELEIHGLNETEIPNMYQCPFTHSSLLMLFYRTNHGWYFTLKNKKEISTDINDIKFYNWTLINPYKKVEEIIKEFDEKLEHRHELII